MRYFELLSETDNKIVGITDGVGQLAGNEQYYSSNEWYHQIYTLTPQIGRDFWRKWLCHSDFAAYPLDGLILRKKCKLTDYMRFDLHGFYVSEKLKGLLEEAHLPTHVFHPRVITSEITGRINEGYYWFAYDRDTGEKTVDFQRSEFDLDSHEQKFGKRFVVNSYEDYLGVFYETGYALSVTKLVFNEHFDNELDVIGFQFLSSKIYVSERLLAKWEENGVTGYIYIALPKLRESGRRSLGIFIPNW